MLGMVQIIPFPIEKYEVLGSSNLNCLDAAVIFFNSSFIWKSVISDSLRGRAMYLSFYLHFKIKLKPLEKSKMV